ncbi:MAG: glycoside hydrolase family 15 protein [Anaerolineales bacterium]|jgi:GH15 family glucan-1,4-alpha-glucosidase
MPYPRIDSYGIIGDLHSVALIGLDGSIDFMCYPEFDSPSIFARLLDHEKGGYFRLGPHLDDGRHRQIYLPDTNILLTRILSSEGVAEISDFMALEPMGPAHNLIRRAKSIRGEIRYRMECAPAFNYARSSHTIEKEGDHYIFASDGPDQTRLRLISSKPLQIEDGKLTADFTLQAGESAYFVLSGTEIEAPPNPQSYVSQAFKDTVNYWHDWIGQSSYIGRWREMVNRSALVLKLLTSWHYGSIVAAPTFSLPEEIGGERNWDYRYTWIRDASFTLYGLIRLGYTQEAARFMHWIEDRCSEMDDARALNVMYRLDGRHTPAEEHLDHLEGYMGSTPVRIGNGAANQLQLDIYGELMDSVYLYDKYGEPISYKFWQDLTRLVNWVGDNWNQPDEGIWEVRGGAQHFLYSRLMCWVAIDRALRLAVKRSLPAPDEEWRAARDEIYADIHNNFWNEDRQAFAQVKGGSAVDASSLLMPLVRFISPTDPRWLKHLKAVEEELVYDSLVHRYKPDLAAPDGLKGIEGTFSMCTFWYVECLSRSGQLRKARLFFEKALGYANHVGLYAEELSVRGEHLGNYPQAFTHLALISAAYDIDRRLNEAGETG